MPTQPRERLLTLVGLVAWGDAGDLTVYRSKQKRMVVFSKTWPDKPASPDQQWQRDRLSDAAIAWQALTPAARAQWELASQRASLCMNGYHLFIHWQLMADTKAIETLERQTNTTLLP